eukprot:SAG31_NODE_543_length_14248_cov_3.230900_4_plen_277_part_00
MVPLWCSRSGALVSPAAAVRPHRTSRDQTTHSLDSPIECSIPSRHPSAAEPWATRRTGPSPPRQSAWRSLKTSQDISKHLKISLPSGVSAGGDRPPSLCWRCPAPWSSHWSALPRAFLSSVSLLHRPPSWRQAMEGQARWGCPRAAKQTAASSSSRRYTLGALSRDQIWDTNFPMISNTAGAPVLQFGTVQGAAVRGTSPHAARNRRHRRWRTAAGPVIHLHNSDPPFTTVFVEPDIPDPDVRRCRDAAHYQDEVRNPVRGVTFSFLCNYSRNTGL